MTGRSTHRPARALPKAWIADKQQVAEDLFKMWLRPEGAFTFKAGQYITIGKNGLERPYSIVSAPHENMIELFIEHVPASHGGQLTPILSRLGVGDHVSMRPAAKGLFLFQPNYHNHVMVGTVTGIAPFVSMVRSAFHAKIRGHRYFLMQGASHQDEFGYDSEVSRLSKSEPDMLTYVATVSRPQAARNKSWNGRTGRVNVLVEEYLDRWRPPPADTLIYLCGHPGMIEDVTAKVTLKGWRTEAERYWTQVD